MPRKFLTSLLRFGSGWFANHVLQRTRRGRRGCHRCVPCAGSLSVGRATSHTLLAAPAQTRMTSKATTISEYLEELPLDRRAALSELRALIHRVAPKTVEAMQ